MNDEELLFNSENAMEHFICEEIKKNGYNPFDESHVSKVYRQVRTGSHGVIDLVFVDYNDSSMEKTITIVELKNKEMTFADVDQILRYKAFFDALTDKRYQSTKFKYQLAGPPMSIEKLLKLTYLSDFINSNGIEIYEFWSREQKGVRRGESMHYNQCRGGNIDHYNKGCDIEPIHGKETEEILNDLSWY